MELEVWMETSIKAPSPPPREWLHVALLKTAGITISWSDFHSMPALLREDLIAWGACESRVRVDLQQGD